MIRIAGAFLILGSSTLLGWYKARQLTMRPIQIRTLRHLLQRLETEIVYGQTPLPSALGHLASQTEEPFSSMLKEMKLALEQNDQSTAEIWQSVTYSSWGNTFMQSQEKDIWLRLGKTLGVSDQDDQRKHLKLAMDHLASEEKTAHEEAKRFASVWRNLGLLGGALLVLVMY